MSSAKERVVNELEDLLTKYTKLCNFIKSENYKLLGENSRTLLLRQRKVMHDYIAVLKMRISSWENLTLNENRDII